MGRRPIEVRLIPGDIIDGFNEQYRFLSNFWRCDVLYEGIVYPTAEHAYQAAKSNNKSVRYDIASCRTPGEAKSMGRRIAMAADFNSRRIEVMRVILRSKFNGNHTLAQKLLATGDRMLVEKNHWNDIYWGVCGNVGENHLGKLLMQIRSELRGEC